jgi:hypothetical protein
MFVPSSVKLFSLFYIIHSVVFWEHEYLCETVQHRQSNTTLKDVNIQHPPIKNQHDMCILRTVQWTPISLTYHKECDWQSPFYLRNTMENTTSSTQHMPLLYISINSRNQHVRPHGDDAVKDKGHASTTKHGIFSDLHSADSWPMNISNKYSTPMSLHMTLLWCGERHICLYLICNFYSIFRIYFTTVLMVCTSHYITLHPSSIYNDCAVICERYTSLYI